MDGSLRVQLLELRDISLSNGKRWNGKVQVMIQCETLAMLVHTETSQVVKIAWGNGEFQLRHKRAAGSQSSTLIPCRGHDVIIRKVPTSGVLTMKLVKVNALGSWAVAKAHLHLDKVQHQLHGGHEIEHVLSWHATHGTKIMAGKIALHAFWMSTEQERLEMELMTLRVRRLLVLRKPFAGPVHTWNTCTGRNV